MKEVKTDFPPWRIEKISACNDITQHAKSSTHPQVMKLIYQNHMATHDQNQFIVYTDGSKSAEGVGYGLTGRQPGLQPISVSVRMQDDSSVFSAELHAILHAVKIVSESELNSMLVYTDPIQKALRAVKKQAPSKYNEPPKHLNNLKCAPLNKINFQSA